MSLRPTPETVAAIVEELVNGRNDVPRLEVVAVIRERAHCSRATAYRALSDAIAAGVVSTI